MTAGGQLQRAGQRRWALPPGRRRGSCAGSAATVSVCCVMASTWPSLVVIEPRTVGIGMVLVRCCCGQRPVPAPVQALHLHQPPGEQRQDHGDDQRGSRSAGAAGCGGPEHRARARAAAIPGRARPAAAPRPGRRVRRSAVPAGAGGAARWLARGRERRRPARHCGRCWRAGAALRRRRRAPPRAAARAPTRALARPAAAACRPGPVTAGRRRPRPVRRSGPRLPPGTGRPPDPAARPARPRPSHRHVVAPAPPAPVPPDLPPAASVRYGAPGAGHGVYPGSCR